jgi:hypothetical protein
MNEVKLGPALDTGAVQAVRPQADRLRWEREWLQQNRRAQTEFTQDGSAAGPNSMAAPAASSAAAPQPEPMLGAPLARAQQRALDSGGPVAAAVFTAAQLAPIAHAAPDAAVAAAAAMLRAPLENTVPVTAAGGAGGTYQRGPTQRSAAWSTEHGVGIALSLPPEQQRNTQVLQTVRQWLKDAGRKLALLIVNGEVRWRSAPPPSDGY